jgi:hypothetical protein
VEAQGEGWKVGAEWGARFEVRGLRFWVPGAGCVDCLWLHWRLRTWLKTLYCSDMDHGCASGNGSAYPMAYKIPKTPPSPPVLPTFLSMTYPTVSCVHSPRALNVMLDAWGGVVTRIPVAWMVPANGPVWVPVEESHRAAAHTELVCEV